MTFTVGAADNCTCGGTNGATITITGAGSCTVTASQAGDANSAATPVSRSFSIAKANQVITFAALGPKTVGDPPFTVSASGCASGNPVTFSVGAVCERGNQRRHDHDDRGGQLHGYAAQAGSANYNAATRVARTFSIAEAAATLALSNLSATYSGSPHAADGLDQPFWALWSEHQVRRLCDGADQRGRLCGCRLADQCQLSGFERGRNPGDRQGIGHVVAVRSFRDVDGSAHAATTTTSRSGLSGVSVTYDGSPTAPTNVGSCASWRRLVTPTIRLRTRPERW